MNAVIEKSPVGALTPATTSEERTWAALAHASTIVTLLFGFPTAGLGGVLLVFIPFLIYLSYKEKSKYVAYHAAQAFALQIVGTVGFFVAFILGVVVIALSWLITVLLMVILVGFILIPVAILITLLVVLIWLAMPFIFGGFSLIATVETANGRDYNYPYVGSLVRGWLEQVEVSPSQPQNLK